MKEIAHLKNARLKYPGGDSLLFKDLNITIHQGEKVLFLGPSGCGKSTLLQVLSGLIPESIEVPFNAEQTKTPQSWGLVFQDPDSQFCMPYVDEEIAFVLENLQVPREEMASQIRKLLKNVGLELEDLHTNIHLLSGGMKQRLAIASVLALDPEVLFLDEPTAMLDPQGTKEIWETIHAIRKDKTFVIVEHKIDHVIEMIDRIILFNLNGEIIADGGKDEIMSQYRDEFIEQGIWYPGVWDHYLAKRGELPKTCKKQNKPILMLEYFRGYRKKEIKIDIPSEMVHAGEWIAVVGKNGAGKSTLLHALMQLINTTGTYKLNGVPIDKVKKLTDEVSFVFQNPEFQFITNSVSAEIGFSLRLAKMPEPEIKKIVEEILDQFRLTLHCNKHPYQLSMGQKRRLSVATQVVNKQKVMLLDEPTFGQDSKNTFAILELLEQLRLKGTTIMMVTHDQHIVDHFSTRVWKISNGKLVDDYLSDRSTADKIASEKRRGLSHEYGA